MNRKTKHVQAHTKTEEELKQEKASRWLEAGDVVRQLECKFAKLGEEVKQARQAWMEAEEALREAYPVNPEHDKRIVPVCSSYTGAAWVQKGHVILEWIGGRTNVEFVPDQE